MMLLLILLLMLLLLTFARKYIGATRLGPGDLLAAPVLNNPAFHAPPVLSHTSQEGGVYRIMFASESGGEGFRFLLAHTSHGRSCIVSLQPTKALPKSGV